MSTNEVPSSIGTKSVFELSRCPAGQMLSKYCGLRLELVLLWRNAGGPSARTGAGSGASAFFLLMAVQNGQYLVGGLSAALLGASIGFLVYNFNPATIFMGDTGSLFLGFMLASVGIKLRFPDNSDVITWMVPVIVLGVPIFDTTLVVFSRIRRGLSPASPGKDHTSHRLVRMGFTQREAVMLLYLTSGMLGMVAVFVTQADFVEAYLLGGSVFLAGLWGIWRMERVPLEQS